MSKDSDLLIERFHVKPSDIWVERNGVTVRGKRPEYLDWPMHTAADMAPSQWPSVIEAQAKADAARKRK